MTSNSVQVSTPALIQMLTDLSHTAASDEDAGAIAGVLIHVDRGHLGEEPGETSLLVGTSTDRLVAGHTYTGCSGHLQEPMLWPITEVRSVIATFKPMAKRDKMHMVAIRRENGSVVIAELGDPALFDDPNLSDEGTELRFTLGSLEDFPRGLWHLLAAAHTNPVVHDHDTGQEIAATPRTDYSHTALSPFCKVARSRGAPIELYRYHQRRAVLVQIGIEYRGVLMPTAYTDTTSHAVTEPPGEVYAPELPDPAPLQAVPS